MTLTVRHGAGAPAMLVRSGTDEDLENVAAMHEARAAGARLKLIRSPELIQYSMAKKRLLAGLGPQGKRSLEFFVAEEGRSAVAYVVLTIDERGWFIEEAGDRDPARRIRPHHALLEPSRPALRVPLARPGHRTTTGPCQRFFASTRTSSSQKRRERVAALKA